MVKTFILFMSGLRVYHVYEFYFYYFCYIFNDITIFTYLSVIFEL